MRNIFIWLLIVTSIVGAAFSAWFQNIPFLCNEIVIVLLCVEILDLRMKKDV